jgi:chromosome segregation protein
MTGIHESEKIVLEANEKAFATVNQNLEKYFTEMLPTKQASLKKLKDDIESGVEFEIKDVSGNKIPFLELSGGQKTLLNISFVFALSRVQKSCFYIIDEVDAALDEVNQKIVGKAIRKIFSDTQVLSISHNQSFQTESERMLFVSKENGITVVKKVIDKK